MSRYDILLPQTPTPADSHGYGTVASVAPLTVLLDGDSAPVYCTGIASVGVGDRVLVLTKRLQRIVLGKVPTVAGGPLIGLPSESVQSGDASPGAGVTLTTLTQTLDVVAGQSYMIAAHLDVLITSGIAIFELMIGDYPWPGLLISSQTGRQPLTRTWFVVGTTTNPRPVSIRTGATSTAAMTVYAHQSRMTITRIR